MHDISCDKLSKVNSIYSSSKLVNDILVIGWFSSDFTQTSK